MRAHNVKRVNQPPNAQQWALEQINDPSQFGDIKINKLRNHGETEAIVAAIQQNTKLLRLLGFAALSSKPRN